MKNLKYYAGIIALAGSIVLSSCGKKEENLNILPDIDAESVYLSTDIFDEIAMATIERQARERFDNYIGSPSILDNEDFINTEEIVISYNNKRSSYELECMGKENTYLLYFDKESMPLVGYMLNHINCETLYLSCVNDIEVLEAISESEKIKFLSIKYSNVDNLEPLKNMISLESLYLENFPNLIDITPLDSLENLINLSIIGTKVSDVAPISKLANLTTLNLKFNEVTNPEVLSTLEKLEFIALDYNKIDDVKKLEHFKNNGLMDDFDIESVIETTTNHEKIFTSSNYEERAKFLTINYLDAQEEYNVEIRDENRNLLGYMLVKEPFYIYSMTKDLKNCTTIILANCKDDDVTRHIYPKDQFEFMTIYNCDFESLYFVSDFRNLDTLEIDTCPNINYEFKKFEIFGTYHLEKLRALAIRDTSIESADAFAANDTLEIVDLQYNNITDYSFLTEIDNLQVSYITIDSEYADYDTFEYLVDNEVALVVNNVRVTSDMLNQQNKEKEKEYTR
ncbi:MAG: hypothetical protein J1F35_07990 [Erysipelotrichales bacterium]|nr:hypothetical protein [Erysipelotrichales bacterium]